MMPGSADLNWRGVSAADVTDSNSEEVAHGGSDDEAAWLDLVGRFDAPRPDDEPAPWPESENLPAGRAGTVSDAGPARAGHSGLTTAGEGGTAPAPATEGGTAPAPATEGGVTRAPTAAGDGAPAEGDGAAAADGGALPAAAADGGITAAPVRKDQGSPATAGDAEVPPALAAGGFTPPAAPSGGIIPALPPSNGPFPAPRGGPDADPLEEEHFVPPPAPPVRLSSAQKGAWVALFGGPGYLLAATIAGWSLPGWLVICAIAAFVGGFMTLVLHIGDGHDRDSNPDDGAVV